MDPVSPGLRGWRVGGGSGQIRVVVSLFLVELGQIWMHFSSAKEETNLGCEECLTIALAGGGGK